MDAFRRRITVEEVSAAIRSAQENNLLPGVSSAIFHDLDLLRDRIAELQAAFPEGTLHAIAVKANPVVEILKEAVRSGAGLEAASIEEVHLALAAGCPPERVIFDSPAKTVGEIEYALKEGIYLNADNFAELERIEQIFERCASTSVVGLRINPQVGSGTISTTSVADADSKFGVPLSQNRADVVDAFARYQWLQGLHVHVGSQGCELPLLIRALVVIDELRREIDTATGCAITRLDIGGGLPTVYQSDKTAITPVEYVAEIERHVPDLLSGPLQLITEFGRAVHANCGFAASRVEYVKPSQQMAVIHLGADFLVRPIYRPQDWPHEFYALDAQANPKTGAEHPVTIVGPLCFGGDIIARGVGLPAIEVGDWLVIRDVGAYTLSMWSRHCSRGIPAVIGYERTANAITTRLLRRAESAADVVRFWS